jgi:hypothetical protein
MPEIELKEKRAKSSLSEFRAFYGKTCCRQSKYNSTELKSHLKCESQARLNTVHLTILIRLEKSIRRVRWRLRGRSG